MPDIMDSPELPTHYIGIGASAGGLEALQEFFGNIPADTGAAFVVVQHLSPDFKSMMPELLGKNALMPIYQVSDGMTLHANTIYLMPPRKNMMIAEGKLLLSDQMPDAHLHMPIDIFLRSLAEDQQHRAIGIVLSGTGSDGTRGIKAIKEAGGLVIVQEPGSAKFDGMPISAFNTGLADFVLAPRDMGGMLVNFISHPSISGRDAGLKALVQGSTDTLGEIFQLLKRQSSINFSQYKASTVARRIERRLGINQMTSLDAYLRLLMESPRELQVLGKELLIGVTRFFRDDEAFLQMQRQVIPRIVERFRGRDDSIRLWIAGCSTGEEAYSLAILFDEYIQTHHMTCGVKIFATDVDDDAIAEASAGIFSLDIAQDVSQERLDRYFVRKDDTYVVSQRLRQMVIFASHNMIEDPPFSNIDLISCRNVLIYFQHSAQKKVLSSLYFALQKEGVLFLGSSESLGDLQSHFETLDDRAKIYVKVSNMRIPVSNTPVMRDAMAGARHLSMAPVASLIKPVRVMRNFQTGVLERLVRQYNVDCIVLNELFEALHVYGDVSVYTRGVVAGRISNNIKDMVVDDLAIAISTALYRCEKNDEEVFYKDVALWDARDNTQIFVDILVFRVRDSELNNAPRYYVVQFIRADESGAEHHYPATVTFDAAEQSRQRIRDLEQELIKKQEHLQVTIEELETTNEELQSANEELMSANEELQSTNEELQSVNEELYTVNSEYQEKIAELTEVNDDLDSVINATDIGIVFLDDQLTIRKFTPAAAAYINLRSGDVGRPFHHISHELQYDELLSDIAAVSTRGEPVRKGIVSSTGYSLLVSVLPYRKSTYDKQSGVLITITNISRQRFMEIALQRAQEKLRLGITDRLDARIADMGKIRVLILDDEPVDRLRLNRMLAADGRYEIMDCETIAEAVVAMREQPQDICLVDYRLADGLTARDFMRTFHENGFRVPVVLLSGYAEEGLSEDLLNTGVYDFLDKDDLSAALLIRSINYVLARKHMQDTLTELT